MTRAPRTRLCRKTALRAGRFHLRRSAGWRDPDEKRCPAAVSSNVEGTKGDDTMSEYIFLFRASEADRRENMGTPERAQKSMQAWLSWIRDLEAKGHLKNPGQPLDLSGKMVRGKKRLVTDGPYTEAKDLVLGFTIIEARDLAQAAELAAGCPILEGDGSVEIRPVMKMTS
jgi:hypothetical protein